VGAVTNKAAFQQIIPQPVSAEPLENGIVVDIPMTAAAVRGRILIVQQPSTVGALESKITLEGGSSLTFRQFVVP
jgi:hypothetical protein